MTPTDELEYPRTVGELIEQLSQYPKQFQIAMSIDEEGNGFHDQIEVAGHNNIIVLYPVGYQKEFEDIGGEYEF